MGAADCAALPVGHVPIGIAFLALLWLWSLLDHISLVIPITATAVVVVAIGYASRRAPPKSTASAASSGWIAEHFFEVIIAMAVVAVVVGLVLLAVAG